MASTVVGETQGLTTSDNSLTVLCNGTTIKQIWVQKTDGSKVKVYQKWKDSTVTSISTRYAYTQQVRLVVTATNKKVWYSGKDKLSYCVYGMTMRLDRNATANDSLMATQTSAAYFTAYCELNGEEVIPSKTISRNSTSDGTLTGTTYTSSTITSHAKDDTSYDQKSYSAIVYRSYSNSSGGVTSSSYTGTSPKNIGTGQTTVSTSISNTLWNTYNKYTVTTTSNVRVEDND